MAIQPIDLSTVYSQMDKMGQFNASQTQSISMASRAHLEKSAQMDSEKARTVVETSKNSESNNIKSDVNQGGGAGQGLLEGDGNQSPQAEEEVQAAVKPKLYEIRDPNLGQHIDVTG